MYLLDTNVVSELRKSHSGKANPALMAWSAGVDASELFVSAITLLEIETGILRLARRDAKQANKLRKWMQDQVLPAFQSRVIPIDTHVALKCAALQVPDPRPNRDALIAATAITHEMTVVTRNTADFAATGVTLINPWEYGEE